MEGKVTFTDRRYSQVTILRVRTDKGSGKESRENNQKNCVSTMQSPTPNDHGLKYTPFFSKLLVANYAGLEGLVLMAVYGKQCHLKK